MGIGLYFSTLRAICVITFIAGLINLYNMLYFASDDYTEVRDDVRDDLTPLLLGLPFVLIHNGYHAQIAIVLKRATETASGNKIDVALGSTMVRI